MVGELVWRCQVPMPRHIGGTCDNVIADGHEFLAGQIDLGIGAQAQGEVDALGQRINALVLQHELQMNVRKGPLEFSQPGDQPALTEGR